MTRENNGRFITLHKSGIIILLVNCRRLYKLPIPYSVMSSLLVYTLTPYCCKFPFERVSILLVRAIPFDRLRNTCINGIIEVP